uniref:Peptidase M12B propeptide domain-containing protein n=1 Tax=Accipiter nisus TaxID=211598 RepID=A0A8B9MRZ3_9AVES
RAGLPLPPRGSALKKCGSGDGHRLKAAGQPSPRLPAGGRGLGAEGGGGGGGRRAALAHPGGGEGRLSSYEIVTPVRVNEFGEAFPHTRHFSRRKRSLEAPLEPAVFRTHYQLTAYGQVFQLNLSADAGFLAAQYAVVHVGAPQEQPSPDLRHCFYRGHVNAQETHMAVFSICGGLVSMLVTPPVSIHILLFPERNVVGCLCCRAELEIFGHRSK